MAEPLLTPEAAAELLGVPRSRILALVRGRAIGSVRAILRPIPGTRARWESRACFEASDPPRWGQDE
jgi:hypothetical protein